ncbi:SDR family oxidoreductase [Bacillus sp. Marseille-P3661]|uniref:SDR family oxidoreductase n=1 Tax=Bacillus sp. Marseille-P3661 TaxID=1936234 RepID=UPI000C84E8B1|nr:SDR family oxidoreductase [Bacillus sp. Marseille-P3661]
MSNKVALITGSAFGIGKRTAKELAAKGNDIIINYRSSETEAHILADQLAQTYNVKTMALKADISNYNDCIRLVNKGLEHFNRIDILINNAGPYIHDRKTLIDYSYEEWNYLINGNLNAAFYLCKEIIPQMRKNKWGRIVNIGFDKAETAPGWACRSAFAAAKVGLVSLTRTLALEEFPYGITVNMVSPGDIRGEWKEQDILSTKRHESTTETFTKIETGEDISRVISFLTDDNSDLITGSVIPISGGQDVLSKSNHFYYGKF